MSHATRFWQKKKREEELEAARKREEKTVETDPGFWDCECEENYIHPKSQSECAKCGARAEEQPDSRADELPQSLEEAGQEIADGASL